MLLHVLGYRGRFLGREIFLETCALRATTPQRHFPVSNPPPARLSRCGEGGEQSDALCRLCRIMRTLTGTLTGTPTGT